MLHGGALVVVSCDSFQSGILRRLRRRYHVCLPNEPARPTSATACIKLFRRAHAHGVSWVTGRNIDRPKSCRSTKSTSDKVKIVLDAVPTGGKVRDVELHFVRSLEGEDVMCFYLRHIRRVQGLRSPSG